MVVFIILANWKLHSNIIYTYIYGYILTLMQDKRVLVKRAVLAMLADTQAAHYSGGFKIGVSFSFRPCCNCMATKEIMKEVKVFSYSSHVHKITVFSHTVVKSHISSQLLFRNLINLH